MYLKFQVGESKQVLFRNITPKPKDGEYGVQYIYEVTVDNEDMVWYATENANRIIQDNKVNAGDVVTISKVTDKQYVYLKNGIPLMPKSGTPKAVTKTNNSEVMDALRKVYARIDTVGKDMEFIKAYISGKTQTNISEETEKILKEAEEIFG